MRCLIDADILSYQCAFAGQFKDERTGELVMKDFDAVEEMLNMKILEITEECMSDDPPLLFLTGDARLAGVMNRVPRWRPEHKDVVLRPSFRFDEAKTKPYKGQRHADKPLHYDNIRAYMLATYETVVSDGVEADDMLAVWLTSNPNYVLCTIDKDLRQVPGWHYSWSIGKRPSIPMYGVTELGHIDLVGKPKKLDATGLKSMFAQTMMGDAVDNVQGIEGFGPVAAYEVLSPCTTELELLQATARTYRKHYPETWLERLREHIDLVYMIRQFDKDGVPIRYQYPEGWELSLDQQEN